jgi:DNA-binding GntR family transcriptional regulator
MATLPGRLQPAHRSRLADVVYDQIRNGVIQGTLPMGSRLIETQLASDLNVSRGPIRLAIQRLIEEGLVVERPHHGAVVREFGPADLVDLYNVRLGIETVAIRLATRNRMDVEPLRAQVALMDVGADAGEPIAVLRHEVEFHLTLCEGCGNRLLANMFRGLEGQLLMALTQDDIDHAVLHEAGETHRQIIAAIESGDEYAAAEALQLDVLSTVNLTVSRLGGDPGSLLPHTTYRSAT